MYSTGTYYVTSNTAYVATGSFNVNLNSYWSYSKSQQQKWREQEVRTKQSKNLKEIQITAQKQQMPNLPFF